MWDLISATDRDGVQTYHLYDGLGSTSDLTDGSGNVIAGYGYDVFGEIRSQSGTGDTEFKFTGEQRDPQLLRNFYYLRARYYDPEIGRFLGQDPLPGGNLYAYVRNNPVTYTDPSGLIVHKKIKKIVTETVPSGVDSLGEALDDLGYVDANLTGCLCVAVVSRRV